MTETKLMVVVELCCDGENCSKLHHTPLVVDFHNRVVAKRSAHFLILGCNEGRALVCYSERS